MGDDSSGTRNTPGGTTSSSELVYMVALGRLKYDPALSAFAATGHQLVAVIHNDAIQPPLSSSQLKQYKNHCKAVMNKGANKLVMGKRIRLVSDESMYDVHCMADTFDEDDRTHVIVFFILAHPLLGKHHPLSRMFDDLRSSVYGAASVPQLRSATSGGALQSTTMASTLQQFVLRYSENQLKVVSEKVEQVKDVMRENVQRALDGVEQLEEMEEKSENLQAHARQFKSSSSAVKSLFRCRYYKLNLILFLVAAAIIALVVYAIYKAAK